MARFDYDFSDALVGQPFGVLESAESLGDSLSVAFDIGLECKTCDWKGPSRDARIIGVERNEQGEVKRCKAACPSCESTTLVMSSPLRLDY
ncbi:MAG: hypothetical protein HY475_02570 [Candidatus Terrybacteria bacterium]|nr:hypothetical protein [Candidatus Terrybacteria bacterium]